MSNIKARTIILKLNENLEILDDLKGFVID